MLSDQQNKGGDHLYGQGAAYLERKKRSGKGGKLSLVFIPSLVVRSQSQAGGILCPSGRGAIGKSARFVCQRNGLQQYVAIQDALRLNRRGFVLGREGAGHCNGIG